ncbi:MAG: DUF72 domain-containing protein [Nanoarchaeota archaeon]
MIRIGSSGYSYEDWKKHFYPPNIKPADMLTFYAQYFDLVEINTSFYNIPPRQMLEHIREKVPNTFEFIVKVYKGITYDQAGKTPEETQHYIDEFNDAISTLVEHNMLSCLLLQFPYTFKYDEDNKNYLLSLKEKFPVPLVIEFRNVEWINEEIFLFLEKNNIGYCCVDEPKIRGLVPPVARVTSEIGYLRFHGRNPQNWFHPPTPADRYDYLYTEEELMEWVPKIKAMADASKKFFVLFNNHPRGQAVKNAAMLSKLLELKEINLPDEKDYDPGLGKFM